MSADIVRLRKPPIVRADPRDTMLEWLWQEYRAALIVAMRVKTPEVEAEVKRSKEAMLAAMNDTS